VVSSHGFVSPIRLEPRASPLLALATIALHASAALLIASLLQSPLRVAALLLVAASLLSSSRKHLLRSAGPRITVLLWSQHAHWTLQMAGGARVTGKLLPGSFVHPWLTVLCFATGPLTRRSVVLVADSLPKDTLRRLRVRLRCQAPGAGADEPAI
jgi:hypothetical protein